MKKLFFIPAVIFVLFASVMINAENASSEENKSAHYTLLAFREKGTGTPISGVAGCLSQYGFNSGAHSYVYLYNIPAGTYSLCGDGEYGYHGTDVIVTNGTSQTFWLDMEVNSLDCACSED